MVELPILLALLIVSIPGLPLSIPLFLHFFCGDQAPGGSGALGGAALLFGVCGLIGWLMIGMFFVGRAFAG